MRTIILLFILLCSGIIENTFSQKSNLNKYHPLSGTVGLSLDGGFTYTRSDFRNADFDITGRLMLDYNFPTTQIGTWGLRAIGGAGYLSGSDGASSQYPELENFRTDILSLGGGVSYTLAVSNYFLPFASGMLSYLYYNPKDDDGNLLPRNQAKRYSRNEYMISGELGLKYIVANNVSLNFCSAINYVDSDNLDDISIGSDNDIFFTGFVGITIYFGGTQDSDRDGVSDKNDLCPDTPFKVIVDRFGCPVDIDNDGIPDYLDKCANTPANIPVNTDGCPVDADGDGVPDYLDLCKETAENVDVDKRGCPLDEDEDNVPDYIDKCPGTLIGTEVDKYGCPLVSQQKQLPEITSMVLSGAVNFEVGKYVLLSTAKVELDKLIKVMNANPATIWRIEGHTDNTGSYSLNKKLSYERANSVASYLVQNGINASRLEFNGEGPDSPIADNSTETGRALNRRVSIEIVGDEQYRYDQVTSPSEEYNYNMERNVGNMIFTDGKLFCYQVSSFKTRSRAEKDAEQMRVQGFNVFIIEANSPVLDGTWYRVRVGYFQSLREAQLSKEKLVR